MALRIKSGEWGGRGLGLLTVSLRGLLNGYAQEPGLAEAGETCVVWAEAKRSVA